MEFSNITTATYTDNVAEIGDGKTHTINEIKIVSPVLEGGYKWFSGFSRDSMLGWEEATWASTPSRSTMAPFAMQNIDDIEFATVPRCEVAFPLIDYKDFIDLQKVLSQRYVYITFFNVYKNEWIENREMAITGNERAKIYNRSTNIKGIQSVKVKFVATQRNIDEDGYTLKFIRKGSEVYNIDTEQKYDAGAIVEMPTNGIMKSENPAVYITSLLYFKECDENGTIKEDGAVFLKGQKFTIFNDIMVTAVWSL